MTMTFREHVPFMSRRRRGEIPYPPADEAAITEALALINEVEIREPSFTPAPARETAAIPALAEAQATIMREAGTSPDTQPQPTQPLDMPLLTRVRDGLRGMAVPNRTAEFLADRAGLPVFGSAVKRTGWHGLHLKAGQGLPPRFEPRRAIRWEARQLAAIGYVTEAAQAQIWQRAAEYDAAEARRRSKGTSRTTGRAA